MKLLVKLKIEFDDDEGTKVERKVWLHNLPSINPTHAIVKGIIEDGREDD